MILRRLPDSRFSEVLPAWKGETVAILGGGPSLTAEQVELVRLSGVKCIAVNNSYLLAPWADLLYFADSHWHEWNTKGIDIPGLGLKAAQVCAMFASFAGQKCSIQNSGANIKDDAVHMMRNINGVGKHGFGLSVDPGALVTGRNGGFQALNIAVLAGATQPLLLGFDGRPNRDGKTHFFGEHPRPTPQAAYPLYRQAMSEAERALKAAGVTVLNCTPDSCIDAFPNVALEVVLP